jgi:hypothetical protein
MRILPFRHIVWVGLLCATAFANSGCSSHREGPLVVPEISFTRYQPIYLDVANIDFVEEYKSPQREPFVEHLLPITPAEAMRAWVKDRIRSVGLNHTMQVIIKDARVVSVELPQQEGLGGVFSANPNRRYDSRLEVELRVYNNGAMSDASVTVVATQSNTISQKATIQERKAAFAKMTFQLMESANAELEKQIFKYFTRYIMYAQTP